MKHIADDHDALLDYLYDEGEPADRLRIAQHLQECADCSVVVLEMQSVRGLLREWTPPAAALGFRIVQDGADTQADERVGPVPKRRGGGLTASRWLQAAAAVLVFVAGMGVSQLRVNYSPGALTIRTPSADAPGGLRNVSVPSTAAAPSAAPSSSAAAAPRVDIGALERELRELRAQLASSNLSADATEQLMQRMRAMIDQSEQRQQRELALRLAQVAGEVDAQHQADLLRIQQSVGQTQDVMDYLVRTSGGVK